MFRNVASRCMVALALCIAVVGCGGDDPGYSAGFQNLSDHAVLVRFDESESIVGDLGMSYPPETLFAIPAHASAWAVWVGMDWGDGGLFGPPDAPGRLNLLTTDCNPVAGFDVHFGDRPAIVIDTSGGATASTADPAPGFDGPTLQPTEVSCPG
jgi:hypothetical protein